MLTADKNVLPDPGRGATVSHVPPRNCAVPQDCRVDSSCMKEFGGVGETWTLLIITRELVKLTALRVPENLGLKTALSQTMSPDGTDWLLKLVEKHTSLAHGVEVGVVDVEVLDVEVLDVEVLDVEVLDVEVRKVEVLDVEVSKVEVLDVEVRKVVAGEVVVVFEKDVTEVTKQVQVTSTTKENILMWDNMLK
jgi:hypothetical protein